MMSPPYSLSEANAINSLRYDLAIAKAKNGHLVDSLVSALKSLEAMADNADDGVWWFQENARLAINRINKSLEKHKITLV